MLNEIFSDLGLKPIAKDIYKKLLWFGTMTAGELSKKLNMPRPTLYGYLDDMRLVGCISQSDEDGVKIFTAESPENISSLYKRKIDEMQLKRSKFIENIDGLKAIANKQSRRPKLHFFEGRHGIQNMHHDLYVGQDISVYSFWPVKSMVDAFGEEHLNFQNAERIKKNIYLKAIWPPSQVVDIKKYPFMGAGKEFLREARIAPNEISSKLSYMVYGHKVMITSSREESYGFILESKDMAEMLIDQFMMIWNISKPVEHAVSDGLAFLNDLN